MIVIVSRFASFQPSLETAWNLSLLGLYCYGYDYDLKVCFVSKIIEVASSVESKSASQQLGLSKAQFAEKGL